MSLSVLSARTDLTSGSSCCLCVAEPFVDADAAEARFYLRDQFGGCAKLFA
jgi:hypothetical protein